MGIISLPYLYRDKPYSSLKPAQPLERDYYSTATREHPDGKNVLSNFGRFESIYRQTNLSSAQPGKYQPPVKNANTMRKSMTFLLF
jgi:hypothetical protein